MCLLADMMIFTGGCNMYLIVDETCRTHGLSKKFLFSASNTKLCDKTKAVTCGDASTVFCINFLVSCDAKLSWYV